MTGVIDPAIASRSRRRMVAAHGGGGVDLAKLTRKLTVSQRTAAICPISDDL